MNISRETLRLKIRDKLYIPITAKERAKQLLTDDFTIISNNCWGGTVYESYGIQKRSPTIGMFIMPADYISFIKNLENYLRQPILFITPEESKWKDTLKYKSNWGTYLIARLGDIELHMLHYDNEYIAEKKWESRVERINLERVIFKFNDQNNCTRQHIKEFMELPFKHKLCFVASKQMKISSDVILVKQPKRYCDGIKASWEPFGKSKYIDLTKYINSVGVKGLENKRGNIYK
jgi:uncharacterized protein (DUF1919 family)